MNERTAGKWTVVRALRERLAALLFRVGTSYDDRAEDIFCDWHCMLGRPIPRGSALECRYNLDRALAKWYLALAEALEVDCG